MNPVLDKASQLLLDSIEQVRKGGEWLVGQIPDVLHQLLLWKEIVGLLSLVSVIAISFGCIIGWKKLIKLWDEDGSYWCDFLSEPLIFLAGISQVGILGFQFYLLINVSDGIKALVTPKLFLLEYAAGLCK